MPPAGPGGAALPALAWPGLLILGPCCHPGQAPGNLLYVVMCSAGRGGGCWHGGQAGRRAGCSRGPRRSPRVRAGGPWCGSPQAGSGTASTATDHHRGEGERHRLRRGLTQQGTRPARQWLTDHGHQHRDAGEYPAGDETGDRAERGQPAPPDAQHEQRAEGRAATAKASPTVSAMPALTAASDSPNGTATASTAAARKSRTLPRARSWLSTPATDTVSPDDVDKNAAKAPATTRAPSRSVCRSTEVAQPSYGQEHDQRQAEHGQDQRGDLRPAHPGPPGTSRCHCRARMGGTLTGAPVGHRDDSYRVGCLRASMLGIDLSSRRTRPRRRS